MENNYLTGHDGYSLQHTPYQLNKAPDTLYNKIENSQEISNNFTTNTALNSDKSKIDNLDVSKITESTNKAELEKLFSHANEVKGDLETVINALVGIIGPKEKSLSVKQSNYVTNSTSDSNKSSEMNLNSDLRNLAVPANDNNGPTVNVENILKTVRAKKLQYEPSFPRKMDSSKSDLLNNNCRPMLSDPGHLDRQKTSLKSESRRKKSKYCVNVHDKHPESFYSDICVKRSKSVLSSYGNADDVNSLFHLDSFIKQPMKGEVVSSSVTSYGLGLSGNSSQVTSILDDKVTAATAVSTPWTCSYPYIGYQSQPGLPPPFHQIQYGPNRDAASSSTDKSDGGSSMMYCPTIYHQQQPQQLQQQQPQQYPSSQPIQPQPSRHFSQSRQHSRGNAPSSHTPDVTSNNMDDSSCSSRSGLSSIRRSAPSFVQSSTIDGHVYEQGHSVSVSDSEGSAEPARSTPVKKIPRLPALGTQLACRQGQLELLLLSQPEQHHRARYMTEGSRGAVKDRSGSGYPTVQLLGWTRPATLQIFVATEDGRVKPHNFYQACKVSGKQILSCKERMFDGTGLIEIQMEPKDNQAIVLDCIGILKLRNVDVERRAGIQRIKQKSTMARLVFRVNLPHGDGFFTCLQVVSDPILCTQPVGSPEICKMSLLEGSCRGGMELFIIGKNLVKSCQVLFQDFSELKAVAWQAEAKIDQEFLHQTHLVCTVPPYCDTVLKSPATVQVVLNCNGRLSEPRYFTYLPDFSEKVSEFGKMADEQIWQNSVTEYDDLSLFGVTGSETQNSAPQQQTRPAEFNCSSKFFTYDSSHAASRKSEPVSQDGLQPQMLYPSSKSMERLDIGGSGPNSHRFMHSSSNLLPHHPQHQWSTAAAIPSGSSNNNNNYPRHIAPVTSNIRPITTEIPMVIAGISFDNSCSTSTSFEGYPNSLDSNIQPDFLLPFPHQMDQHVLRTEEKTMSSQSGSVHTLTESNENLSSTII